MLDMIRDSAAAIAPRGDLSRVRGLRFQSPGFDPGVWRQMGEMGWIGLRQPEAQGGIGLGLVEYCVLAEALGRGLVPEPLVQGVLAAAVLGAVGAPLDALLAGESLPMLAWQEAADTLEVPGSPEAPRLFLPMATGATGFLVPVRESGGLALFAATGALTTQQTQDGGHFGSLSQVTLGERLGGDVRVALAAALDEAALATAAYLLGVMEASFAMTLEYLRTRRQFGRAIGSFQALQHRAVDLKIQLALTRASVEAAAAAPSAAAISRAKARAAEASMLVTRAAVQLHGAIGYTDEYDVGLYLRKAMVLANQFGSAGLHRRRFMALAEEE